MLPFRLLPRSRFGRALLRTSILTIAMLLLLFIVEAAVVQTSVRNVIAQQEAIRHAEVLRSLMLRLQIDEETGLRGYIITGDVSFLQPFDQARAQLRTTFAEFDAQLRGVAPSLAPAVHELEAVNGRWLTTYALPIIAQQANSNTVLELRGKGEVDLFRTLSSQLADRLTQIADAGDRSASTTVALILVGSVLFGVILALALLFYAIVQSRMEQALTAQSDEYERLRRISATLQEAFLVEPLPHMGSLSFDAVYAPALEEARIGGDWYGVFPLPDGRVYFSVGDVAGHGVAASVTMARIRQTILSIAMHELDPSVVLNRANEVLRLRTDTMVTALCGFVDPVAFEITYASAGHPPPLLVSENGRAVFLPTSGAPLGVTADPAARTYSQRAPAGSMLVLYTDGITEFDRNIVRGERRLRDVAATIMRGGASRPASAILRRALGASVQRDDIALLAIRFADDAASKRGDAPPSEAVLASWRIERNDPATAREARVAFVAALQELGGIDVLASEMIFGELVANALEHGAGTIEARLSRTDQGLMLVVTDSGSGILRASRDGSPAPSGLEPRGRGLHIVRMLAQDVRVAEQPGSAVFALLPQERASESA